MLCSAEAVLNFGPMLSKGPVKNGIKCCPDTTQRANLQVNEGLANVSVITTEINLLSTLLKRLT